MSLKGPKQQGSVHRQESLVNLIRDPHYLNSRKGLLSSGVDIKSGSDGLEEIHLKSGGMVLKLIKRKD